MNCFLVPGAAPKTDIGSFEVTYVGNDVVQRQAYIYWKQVPDYIKNGEDFKYKIQIVGNNRGYDLFLLSMLI